MKNYPNHSDFSQAELKRRNETAHETFSPTILTEEEYEQLIAAKNFHDRFCSGTFQADIICADGFELLHKKGLL